MSASRQCRAEAVAVAIVRLVVGSSSLRRSCVERKHINVCDVDLKAQATSSASIVTHGSADAHLFLAVAPM
jgi:hypothetical protein